MKKLYRKAKKRFKTWYFYKRNKKELPLNENSQTIKSTKKPIGDKLKPTASKMLEKGSVSFKRGSSLRSSLKKVKDKIKHIKTSRSKKIISSKKLALLLTAAIVATLLPTFHLTPVPALVAASTCVFTINFIMVKSVKKFLKHRKQPSSNIQNISVELEKKANRIE